MELFEIKQHTKDETVNIVLDTLERNKQALIFTSSKASAEKTAEEIAKHLKTNTEELNALANEIEEALQSPTKQCLRLGKCVRKGVAFHHAGLVQKQKEAIEDAFREGKIKIIAATPTLAIGIDLPSYRTIIKSLKRYSGQRGMQYIPVLEYHQMAGRSGRPGKDTRGEALTIASTEAEKESIYEKYIIGDIEEIYSKLAVEPVLRTYILSLIASKFVRTREEIFAFFEKTFWAHQFQDMERLNATLQKMLKLLESFRFIHSSTTTSEFISAADLNTEKYNATEVGERVSQLYLDPLTANMIITALEKAQIAGKPLTPFNLLQLFSATLELRPLLTIKTKDYEEIEQKYIALQDSLITEKPTEFDMEYEEYLSSIKTALFFSDWIEEKSEEFLLEKYDARPGEVREKLEKIDWICYATLELSKMLQLRKASAEIHKLRVRLEYGAREELLPLLKLKNIGKIRARKLFNNKIKDIGDVKKADLATLTQLLGPAIAVDIKKQVGEKVENVEIKPTKRKGQMSLGKYT